MLSTSRPAELHVPSSPTGEGGGSGRKGLQRKAAGEAALTTPRQIIAPVAVVASEVTRSPISPPPSTGGGGARLSASPLVSDVARRAPQPAHDSPHCLRHPLSQQSRPRGTGSAPPFHKLVQQPANAPAPTTQRPTEATQPEGKALTHEESNHVESSVLSNGDDEMPRLVPLGGAPSSSLTPKQHNLRNGTTTNNIREGLLPVAATPTRGPDVTSEVAVVEGGWSPQPTKPVGNSRTDTSPWSPQQFSVIVASASPSLGHPATPQQTHPRDASYVDSEHRRWSGKQSHPRGVSVGQAPVAELEPNLVTGHPHRHSRIAWIPPTGKHEGGTRVPIDNSLGMAAALLAGVTPGVNDGDSCALRGFQPVVGADPPQRRTVSSSPSRNRQHDVIDDGSWAAIGPRYAEPPPNLAPPSSAIPKPHAEAVRDPLARYLERATAATASQLTHRPPQASAANMLLAQGGNEAGKSSLRPSNNVIKQQQEQDQLGDRASHTVVVVPTSSKSLRGIHHDAPPATNRRVSPLLSPAPTPSKQSKASLLSPGIDEGTAVVPSGGARQYRPPYVPVTNVKKASSPPDDLMARRVESIAESTSHPPPPLPAASPPKGQLTTAPSSTLRPAALSALNAEEAEERRLVIFEFNQAHHELRLEEQLCCAAVCVAEVVTAKEETVRLKRSLDNQMRARSDGGEDPPLGNTGDKSSTSPHQKATALSHPTRSPSPRNPFPYPLLGGTAAAGRGRRIVPGVEDMVASLAGEVEGLQEAYGEQERINRALLKAAEMRSFDLLSQLKRCIVRGLQWPTSVHSDERRERDALLWAFRAGKASSVASPKKKSSTASRPRSEGGGRRLVSPSFDKLVGSATMEDPQPTNISSEKVAPSVSTVVPSADYIGFRYEEGRRQLVAHEGRAREKIRLKAADDWERAANTEQDRRLQEGPSPRRRPQEQHAAASGASLSDVSTIELARPRRGSKSPPSLLAPDRESSVAYRLKMALLELEANEAAERAEIAHQEQHAGEEGDHNLRQGHRQSGSDRLSSFWEMLQWWFSSAAANLEATSSKCRLVEAVEGSRRDAIAKAAFRGTIDLLQQMLVHKRFIDERVLGKELVALDVSIPDAVVSGAVYLDGLRRSAPSTPPTHTNDIDSSDCSTASIMTSTSALNRHRSPSLSDVHDSVHGGSRATRSDVSTSIAAGSSRQVVTPTRSGLGAARRRDADFYELERQGFGEQARLAELSTPVSTTTPNQSRRRLSVDISGGSSARRRHLSGDVPGIRVSRNLLTNERLEEAASFRDVSHKGAAHYERLQSLLSTRLNRSPSATPGRVPPSMRTVSGGIRRSSPQRVIPASHPDAFDPGRRTPTRHQREHAAELLQTFLSHGQSAARTPSASVAHLVVPQQEILLPYATRRSSSLSNQTKLRTRPAGLKKAKSSRLPKRVMRRTASSGAGDGGHLADSSATQDVFATPPVPRQHSPHHHRLQERIEQLIREKREVEEELRRERQRAEASLPSTHHLPQTAASLDSDVDEQQHRSIMHPSDQLHSLDPHYSERVHLKQYQAMIRNGGGGTRRLPSTGRELSPSNADSSGHQAAPFSEPSFTEADARYKRRIHQAATKVAGSLGCPANRHPIGEGADWAWAHEGDDDSFFVSRNPTHDIRPVVIPKMRELHPSDEDSSEFEAGSSQQRPTHRRPLSTAADWALAPSTPHRPQSTVEPRHRDGGGVQQGRSVGSAHRPHQRLAFGSAGRHHTDEASQMSSMSGASPRPAPPDQLDGHPFTLNRSLWASQDDGPSIIRQAHSNATAPLRGDARAGSVPSYAAPTAAWRKKRITAGTARKDVFGTNAQRLFNMDASVNESAGISDHPPRRVKVGRGSYLDVFVRQKAEVERAPSTRRPSPPQHISTNNKPTVAISAKAATTVARQQKPRLPVSPQRGPRAASDVSPTHRRTTVAHLNEENARKSPPQPQSHNVTIDLDESDILRRPSSCSTSDADKASPPQQMAPIITAPHTNTKPRGAAVIGKKNSATTAAAPATTAAAGARRVKVPSRQAAASSLAGAPKASGERTALSKFEAAALARYHIHNKTRL